MDEAKSLVHMAVSALFASMILAAAVGLIHIGYSMWSYFSRQETANERMSTYANYTAFDNTTVRGQEVIQLIESDPDLFVVIFNDTKTSLHSIDNMSTDASNADSYYYPDLSGIKDYDLSLVNTVNTNVSCKAGLSALRGTGTFESKFPSTSAKYLNNYDYNKLVTIFTSSKTSVGGMPTLGKPVVNDANQLIESGSYAAFKSSLVYAEDGTTDVVGVVLVRENAYVDEY